MQSTSPRIGLRFTRSQAAPLQRIADRIRAADLTGRVDITTFEAAAEAARTGEPLIVICDHPDEAIAMADAYIFWGIRRPAVEALGPPGG